MLPQPIFSFEKFGDLDTIVKPKRVQRWVTYFCTQPLYSHINIDTVNTKCYNLKYQQIGLI